ncbi:hypothetical protein [Bradyrhizobium sp. AUGA SZCCT0160]|uniref:hypothetical protein n=1 Tax=Bradyrhizobium sp. AUGA SZCCT0160 TaxID=2807662 RepID=UPI001BAC1D11|nr:hypothetical protein [Bradyrhizobium sp. AUGA SZCCT0160]MBR1187280.1 hypothetical protein [Bradyrhizobium sp. AUGA SZCCT0160]
MVTKEELKRVMEEVDELNLPDGAHWALVHERLGLEYGEVFEIIAGDPVFFGAIEDGGR